MGHDLKDSGFSTKAIHAGQNPEQWASRAIIPLIVFTFYFIYS
jgi:O-acetylhomoserine/O-acetylserine sulfhydrylase-like pyridoxal-dependent enzyme